MLSMDFIGGQCRATKGHQVWARQDQIHCFRKIILPPRYRLKEGKISWKVYSIFCLSLQMVIPPHSTCFVPQKPDLYGLPTGSLALWLPAGPALGNSLRRSEVRRKEGLSTYPPAPSLLSYFVRILPSTKVLSSYQTAPSIQLPSSDSGDHSLSLFLMTLASNDAHCC